jgi:predicted DNA-binding WGR domain protein
MKQIMQEKRLEFIEGKSAKFYQLQLIENEEEGNFDVMVDYGRIGTAGQRIVKAEGVEFTKANAVFEKMLKEKTDKGYVEASE